MVVLLQHSTKELEFTHRYDQLCRLAEQATTPELMHHIDAQERQLRREVQEHEELFTINIQ